MFATTLRFDDPNSALKLLARLRAGRLEDGLSPATMRNGDDRPVAMLIRDDARSFSLLLFEPPDSQQSANDSYLALELSATVP